MDQSQIEFENWLFKTWEWLQISIRADPKKYKVVRNASFDQFIVLPSRSPEEYPPELRTRLASTRGPSGGINDIHVTAVLETQGQPVDPVDVWAGSYITPIFKLAYYKIGDDFGLTLTLLKGEYEPATRTHLSNEYWIIDSKTSGSEEESSPN